jgi:hypothetical protein
MRLGLSLPEKQTRDFVPRREAGTPDLLDPSPHDVHHQVVAQAAAPQARHILDDV